jgi:quinol monooxygenase YgiN
MSSLDRRAFLQTAALGGALATVFHSSSAEAAEEGGYYVIAELVAKPGSEKAVRDLMVALAQESRREAGCQLYTLLEVTGEPGRFLTFERWTNKAAADAHMTTPHLQAAAPKIEPLLAKPFTQLFLGALTGA